MPPPLQALAPFATAAVLAAATQPENPYGLFVAPHTQLDTGSGQPVGGFIVAAIFDCGSSQLLDESHNDDCFHR